MGFWMFPSPAIEIAAFILHCCWLFSGEKLFCEGCSVEYINIASVSGFRNLSNHKHELWNDNVWEIIVCSFARLPPRYFVFSVRNCPCGVIFFTTEKLLLRKGNDNERENVLSNLNLALLPGIMEKCRNLNFLWKESISGRKIGKCILRMNELKEEKFLVLRRRGTVHWVYVIVIVA